MNTSIKSSKTWLTYLLLGVILLGCFLVHLYKLDKPIGGWHSWRQTDTSAVSRSFVTDGYDILHPRFEDLSNVPSGKDNPQGYRFVEFPLYNIAQAGLYQLVGGLRLEGWGRMVSNISSVFATLFIFLIVRRNANQWVAFLCAFFYAFFPFNIFYGRTVLPDTSTVMATLGGINFFDKWLEQKTKVKKEKEKTQPKSQNFFFIFAIIFTASAFLLKPYALFFVLPMVVIAYNRYGFSFFLKWHLWLFAIITLLPLVWWRIYMLAYPEGIPSSAWLLNGNGIRFKPAFFRWMVYERLIKLISGYIGILLLPLGFFEIIIEKNVLFFSSFLVAALVYVFTFATGNVQHDYYQILVMPSLAILYGFGAWYLVSSKHFNKRFPLGIAAAILITALGFYFSWQQVKQYYNVNNPSIFVAGKAVDELTPKNAKVIANYNGDTTFLYYTNRKGWASYEHALPEMVKLGADYLAITNPVPSDYNFGKDYKIVAKSPQYIIFNLREKP